MTPLAHFLRLVQAGKHSGCSSGEQAARRLALATLRNMIVLDGQARAGFEDFAKLVYDHPTDASDLVK